MTAFAFCSGAAIGAAATWAILHGLHLDLKQEREDLRAALSSAEDELHKWRAGIARRF